jgi:adenosine deaminase
MPKVELHVHLEGSVRPETLLTLARRNGVALPADTVEGVRQWYTFTGFPHFVNVYLTISDCMKTLDDIELVAREFLIGQAAQNIVHSEVTFTPFTHTQRKGLPIDAQIEAINRARAWGETELGVSMCLITDIAREVSPEDGLHTADAAIRLHRRGVDALGLGGYEVGNPPEKHAAAFERAHHAGVPCILHAGETEGPASIRGALRIGYSQRIGHGVRCLEDAALMDELRDKQIPLEVCPSSNVCLGVFPRMTDHPLLRLIEAGLYVTLNSDDPPMFNTTLTDEYRIAAHTFGLDAAALQRLSLNALRASLLPAERKAAMETQFTDSFAALTAALSDAE